jgi:RNA 2',3'-cyclic 3'-phosphodiesterase
VGSKEPVGLTPRETARRLFFALWPDEAMRQAMAQAVRTAAQASGGRPVPAANLHVTLAFLGSVPEGRLPELTVAARGAAATLASAFSDTDAAASSLGLVFDRLEHWRAAQLLCALPAEPLAPVAGLARKLQEALVAHGFAPDLKPFRPHVTVARKVARAVGGMHPVVWRFTELALIESRTLPDGALYGVVDSYGLGLAQYPCAST